MREIPCPQCGEPMRRAEAHEVAGGEEALARNDVRICERDHGGGLYTFMGYYAKVD